jgi:UDP-N-acetyl-D-galactosamine dehydrogenase
MINSGDKICVVGLGYVGLPLAVEFGKYRDVIGFDIDENRISELKSGRDKTNEISTHELKSSKYLNYTNKIDDIRAAKVYIITVPTPINANFDPDLRFIHSATELVASVLSSGDYIIYESTVYPGLTEEFCVPIIENISGFYVNDDFQIGYSPERINPGDHSNRLPNITKITSGGTPDAAIEIDTLYSQIIQAGTYKAESIKVAEAAKVIENIQRDINIGLVNELSNIFNLMGIDTLQVLNAAASKWNFTKYVPGLVGGHCIGVDPYYLTHKAKSLNYYPEMILAGRRINENVPRRIVDELLRAIIKKKKEYIGKKVLILGVTFKENCPDVRNSKIIDVYNNLHDLGISVDIYDPVANTESLPNNVKKCIIKRLDKSNYVGIILAVAHCEFLKMKPEEIKQLSFDDAVFFDVKSVFSVSESDLRL